MTESAAEVKLIVPNENYQKVMDLYDRYAVFLLHGEDARLFQTDRYCYMSCFVRDIATFKAEFENEEMLKPLFNHGKGKRLSFLSVSQKRLIMMVRN
jgi:mRNA-degrading endonuclease HigB of HigAB toxin-antitoxin module